MKERATVICRREDQILFVRKHKAKWTLPGGKVESGETPAQAAVRELGEETGLAIAQLSYIAQFEVDKVRHHLFETPSPVSDKPSPKNEIADCKWFSHKDMARRSVSSSIKSLLKSYGQQTPSSAAPLIQGNQPPQ